MLTEKKREKKLCDDAAHNNAVAYAGGKNRHGSMPDSPYGAKA